MGATRRVRSLRGAAGTFLITTLVVAMAATAGRADDTQSQIESLRREVDTLRRRDAENRARMAELERMLHDVLAGRAGTPTGEPVAAGSSAKPSVAVAAGAPAKSAAAPSAPPATSPNDALDRALAAGGPSTPTIAPTAGAAGGDILSAKVGGAAQARLIDIAFSTLIAGGGSSVGNHALGELEGGGHDPDQNGFTLQQGELSLSGAVDPYFSGEAHIVATDDDVELEEAFFTTSSLPFGLQVEAGYSLTEFGIINPSHPHSWDWLDQPVINTRMFGGDGTRSPGVRVGWLLPLPFFSELHVGVQNANEGEFTPSFMASESVGGRPSIDRDVRSAGDLLWLVRSDSSWDLNADTALILGASALYGPNQTGPDGHTWIYGIDAKLRWRPQDNFRGWPFVLWQTEAIGRSYHADGFTAGTDVDPSSGEFPFDLASDTIHDEGFYTQLLYGFHYGWAAGLRAEYATGSGDSVAGGVTDSRESDPMRDDRLRISPVLIWHPTEFSRLRLQYNYDDADHLHGGDAHTVWIGAEVLYGKHAAHKY